MYTIGQVSEMFNIPISTLRFYDKEGLFPNLIRKSNIRYFSDGELESLRVIECLKMSGLSIEEIKEFFSLVSQGPNTYEERKKLFEERKKAVENEIANLERTLSMLKYKCWYYDKAIADGNEKGIGELLPDKLPTEIQKLYDHAHNRTNS